MLRDITLGQYYAVDSPIHRLDPRVKIIAAVIYIIELFLVKTFVGFAICFGALAIVVAVAKVPVRYILRGLKPVLLILFFTFFLNMFMIPGTVIWRFWKLTITAEGLRMTIHMAFRLTYLIVGSSIMTLTTTPNQLTDGLETGLRAFNKIHVPVHEVAMMMSIALRFIPILMDETDKIMKAQEARGADFSSGGIIRKAKALVPLLVPLFVSAFRRANDLALAMEARGYHGGDGRTKMKPLVYHRRDRLAYVLILLYVVIMFLLWRYVKLRLPLPGLNG